MNRQQAGNTVANECSECVACRTPTTTTQRPTTTEFQTVSQECPCGSQEICDTNCVMNGEDGSCAGRINWVVDNWNYALQDAINLVAKDCQAECGQCNPGSGPNPQPVDGECGPEFNDVETGPVQRPSHVPANLQFVWSDEFDGDSLDVDRTHWEVERHWRMKFNGEEQEYVDEREHVYQNCGALTIKATHTGGDSYKSGRISSNSNGSQSHSDPFRAQRSGAVFKYGYMESRISFDDYAKGTWPAFWMLGDDINTVGWPTCGETDIMEHARNWGPQPANHNTGSLHYPERHGGNAIQPEGGKFRTVPGGNIREWHTYGLLWDEQFMEWFVDGVSWGRLNTPQTYKDREFFFILNLAVGGNLGNANGAGVDKAAFSPSSGGQRMLVDYVRVWQ